MKEAYKIPFVNKSEPDYLIDTQSIISIIFMIYKTVICQLNGLIFLTWWADIYIHIIYIKYLYSPKMNWNPFFHIYEINFIPFFLLQALKLANLSKKWVKFYHFYQPSLFLGINGYF